MAINVFDSFLRIRATDYGIRVDLGIESASYIDGPLRIAVMLYVILYGFAVMRGAISEPVMEFAWRAMRIVVVVLLATNSSAFQHYVTGLFFDSLPKEIGNALAGAGLNTNSGAPFDQLLSKGIDVANRIYKQAGLTNIAPALIAAILLVFVAVGSFLQFAILLYAKVGLGVVIALGPVFIALGLFEATRPFTSLASAGREFRDPVGAGGRSGRADVNHRQRLYRQVRGKRGNSRRVGGGCGAISAVLGLSGYIALQLPIIAGGLAGGGASLASRLVTSPLVANATAAAGGAYAGARWSASRGLAAVRASRQGGSMRRTRSQGTTAA